MRVIVLGGSIVNEPHVHRSLDMIRITHLLHDGSAVGQCASAWGAKHLQERRVANKSLSGAVRNQRMLEWKPDLVVAFGTDSDILDMLDQAAVAGVRVLVLNEVGPPTK
jgi:hypothetical protein